MDVVIVGDGDQARRGARGDQQVVRDRGTERRYPTTAQVRETMDAAGIFRTHGEHFPELEVGKGDGVAGTPRGGVLDTREGEREVTAFDRLVDVGPLRSEERRVGEEGRFRWWPDHLKKKKISEAWWRSK